MSEAIDVNDVLEIIELDKKIEEKKVIEQGDKDVIKYNHLLDRFHSLNMDISQLITFTRDLCEIYETDKEDFETIMKDTYQDLKSNLSCAQNYLKKVLSNLEEFTDEMSASQYFKTPE